MRTEYSYTYSTEWLGFTASNGTPVMANGVRLKVYYNGTSHLIGGGEHLGFIKKTLPLHQRTNPLLLAGGLALLIYGCVSYAKDKSPVSYVEMGGGILVVLVMVALEKIYQKKLLELAKADMDTLVKTIVDGKKASATGAARVAGSEFMAGAAAAVAGEVATMSSPLLRHA